MTQSGLGKSRRRSRNGTVLLAFLFSVIVLILNFDKPALSSKSPNRQVSESTSRRAENVAVSPAETLESCLKCHDKIEPMHKFGPTATLDKLDHGKDALGLTCTACHGGNPIAIEKDSAHVRPRFPREWDSAGEFKIRKRSGPLLARESLEFVRFINPGALRV